MANEYNRRRFMQLAVVGTIGLYFRTVFGAALSSFVLNNGAANPGNFHAIFKDPQLKDGFFLFLKNVYNIYPEKEFHQLISKLVDQHKTDQEIYRAILARLGEIKPLFSELTHALPALAKQKKEIADETMEFLKRRKSINGYLEIGTPGRYISELKNRLKIEGPISLINVTEPSYSPLDVVERGRLPKLGHYIPLDDYRPIPAAMAGDATFEVVTNFIGFHHSTLDRLDGFVTSVHRVLKPGGSLILRDHDVIDEKMNAMVSLAHDVFNAGLKQTWDYNHQEVRNFRPLTEWIAYLKDRGFQYQGKQILQPGDPTKNTLMEFVKA